VNPGGRESWWKDIMGGHSAAPNPFVSSEVETPFFKR
jgi:hypothetical protein